MRLSAFFATTLAILAVPASAAVVTTSFVASGSIASGTADSFTFNGTNYQTFSIALTGFTPATIAQGDVLSFDISLDGAFEVPDFQDQFFGLGFSSSQPDADTVTGSSIGIITGFTDPVAIAAPVEVGCGNCINALYYQNGGAFSFTGFTGQLTVTTLSAPLLIDGLTLSYQVSTPSAAPVPEPASWAVMVLGFGLTGAAMRRRVVRRTVAA